MKWVLLLGAVFKVILWILLIILAAVLLILAVLLLCGIKYEAKGDFKEKNRKANGFVSWLFNLVRVDFAYDEAGFRYNFKFPFKSLVVGEKKQKKKTPVSENSDDRVVTAMDNESAQSIKNTLPDNNKREEQTVKQPEKARKKTTKKTRKAEKKKKEESVFSKLKNAYYEYEIKSLYEPLKRFLKSFFKAIGIKKARADLTFGFDDPSVTGMVLGGGCMAAAFLPFDLRLKGYFDGALFDGNAVVKGKTCIFAILVPTVRLVLEKPVWKLIKKLK